MSEQQTAIILETDNPDATRAVGRCLGQLLKPGDVICLQGDLGSGKTCLTQGIGAGMGVAEVINSPTFVFVNEHAPLDAGPYLYHVDLYRMCDLNEVLSLGLEDYMYGDGVTVIEWADRASEMMPARMPLGAPCLSRFHRSPVDSARQSASAVPRCCKPWPKSRWWPWPWWARQSSCRCPCCSPSTPPAAMPASPCIARTACWPSKAGARGTTSRSKCCPPSNACWL